MSPPLLLGLSGPSSSGKTTLARLLREVFSPSRVFIVHLDDFYRTDAEIPVVDGVQDWDCLESLDLAKLQSALLHIRNHSKCPDWLVSLEDQNSTGQHGVSDPDLSRLRGEVHGWLDSNNKWTEKRICIVDGFLLYSEKMKEIRALFDTRLFLRTSYKTVKRRREARSGYVTLEGFWTDPPGYVDKVVWPNYVKEHAFLFQEGDVEGEPNGDVCRQYGIQVMPTEAEANMTSCLQWSLSILKDAINE